MEGHREEERSRTDGNGWGDQDGKLGGENCISRSPEEPTEGMRFSLVAYGWPLSKPSL